MFSCCGASCVVFNMETAGGSAMNLEKVMHLLTVHGNTKSLLVCICLSDICHKSSWIKGLKLDDIYQYKLHSTESRSVREHTVRSRCTEKPGRSPRHRTRPGICSHHPHHTSELQETHSKCVVVFQCVAFNQACSIDRALCDYGTLQCPHTTKENLTLGTKLFCADIAWQTLFPR